MEDRRSGGPTSDCMIPYRLMRRFAGTGAVDARPGGVFIEQTVAPRRRQVWNIRASHRLNA